MHDSEARTREPRRRDLLGATLATAGAAGGMLAAGCASPQEANADERLGEHIAPGSTVLFQGDSITDAGRIREEAAEPNVHSALGSGYAWLAAAGSLVHRPDLVVFNRGISGNKVYQLDERWQEDCFELKPNVLSVLIGVNDIWHSRNGDYEGTVEIYERDYDLLLERTCGQLRRVLLVVCEPFVLRCGAVDASWFPEFDEYRAAARRVADKHGAIWVGFQGMFDRATRYAPPEHWAKDGVHPSAAGAALMSQLWLREVMGVTGGELA